MELKVGNTPLFELKAIKKYFNLPNSIYAKVECDNLTGSIKDRAVYQMLLDDYASGRINKDTVLIEATSGNTGISLAAFGEHFGNKVIIVMPSSMSIERRNRIRKYNAELVLVDGGIKECNDKALEINKSMQNSVILGQFKHKSNAKAHLLTTGPEIFAQLKSCKYLFLGIGSGGTIMGLSDYVRSNNIDCKIIGIEPAESPLITKGIAGPHGIQGIGTNFIPELVELDKIDEVITVESDESITAAIKIRELENLFVGYSSGAALVGAINYCKQNNIKEDVVVIFPDKGDRYEWPH